jgi:uncharacterized protein (TIRG00374 family)
VKQGRKYRVPLLRTLGGVAAFAILWLTFRQVDPRWVQKILVSLGPWILVAALPELGWLVAETVGWQWGFRVLGRRVAFGTLFRVRLSMEAVGATLPGGVVLAESLAPSLLKAHADIPMVEGVTGVLARKFLLLGSQAAYMLLIFLVGTRALRETSLKVLGRPGLEWLVLAGALVLGAAALVVRLTLHRGAVGKRLYGLLRTLPGSRWQAFLVSHRKRFCQADNQMSRFFGARKRRLSLAALPFVVAWMVESAETWLLLDLVGAKLDFVTVASFEVVVVLLFRHLLFVLPAGLGAQDAAYVAFLSAVGIRDPVTLGAAFVVLKRGKELAWALLGAGCLVRGRRAARLEPDSRALTT